MILTDILQSESSFNVLDLLGAGTLGTILTMVVQKVMSSKKDNADLLQQQLTIFNDMHLKMNEVIEKLQKMACYKEPCKNRINGEGE